MKRFKLYTGILLFSAAGGCAHVEPFADRATAFNEEVAKTQNATLMLNVLRAAYRYPMHFTELSTLSGTETVTGSAGLSIPFSHIYGTTDARLGTLSTSVSQSPTFNVAVLETQEFYRGMLTQLTLDEINGYISEGIPREVIFMLASSGFRYQASLNDDAVTISNNFHEIAAGSPESRFCRGASYESECFMQILHALEARHLNVEQSKDVTNIGPPLEVTRLASLKELQLISQGGLQITAFDLADCEEGSSACGDGKGFEAEIQERLLRGETLYRVQKIGKESRLCFDLPLNAPGGSAPLPAGAAYDADSIAHQVAAQLIPTALICSNRKESPKKRSRHELLHMAACTTVFMGPKEKADLVASRKCAALSADSETSPRFSAFSLSQVESGGRAVPLSGLPSVQIRSTEGVIYYLGEITRCEIFDATCPTPTAFIDDLQAQKPLFKVVIRGTARAANEPSIPAGITRLTVPFQGNHYEVFIDPKGDDRSGQVLRVVTQLVALNRSAKDFPVPAVIPLISR